MQKDMLLQLGGTPPRLQGAAQSMRHVAATAARHAATAIQAACSTRQVQCVSKLKRLDSATDSPRSAVAANSRGKPRIAVPGGEGEGGRDGVDVDMDANVGVDGGVDGDVDGGVIRGVQMV